LKSWEAAGQRLPNLPNVKSRAASSIGIFNAKAPLFTMGVAIA
jgi:hypothetical protein